MRNRLRRMRNWWWLGCDRKWTDAMVEGWHAPADSPEKAFAELRMAWWDALRDVAGRDSDA